MHWLKALGASLLLACVAAKDNGLQDIVTWDKYSLKIHGERIFLFGGEFHPYRMPVHTLYLDVFQKIKSIGLNAVSFYTFWGLHEPKRGAGIDFSGFRNIEPFIQAAQQAGIYLIARPGPYINAETTGGGFPGWGARDTAIWRTSNSSYTDAWEDYISEIGKIIAKYQITNGGPIILVQSENEYTSFAKPYTEDFDYEKKLLTAFRDVNITVPITFNDASPSGRYTSVDIWGYDSYPNGFDCSSPYSWRYSAVPTGQYNLYQKYAPADTPNAVYEFQGGAFDGWGGSGYSTCSILTGPEFERVFYKDRISQATTIFSIYMIYGGTNWGGIAHPGVYTSYDYGSAIAEDRTLREKAYELKLQANFYTRSPAILTSKPQNIDAQIGAFTGNNNLNISHTQDLVGNLTSFYIVRHTNSSSFDVQSYTLKVPTSKGIYTLPSLGDKLKLTLTGKDSKIHVVDYFAGSTHLLFSTGEIATWATIDNTDVFVLYGNTGEIHETAIVFNGTSAPSVKVVSGTGKIQSVVSNGVLIIQYITTGQAVIQVGTSQQLYVVDRANAYQFWTMYPPVSGVFSHYSTQNPVLIKGGYLIRNISTTATSLALTGDLNSTATFEIIAPSAIAKVSFNGEALSVKRTSYGRLVASKNAKLPEVTLPSLQDLTWKTADSLPEIQSSYSDASWVTADHTSTNNTLKPNTPTVLYSSDYGFHTGNIFWRGHFTSTGSETSFNVTVAGGAAFGFSVWLDSTFLGSWYGDSPTSSRSQGFTFTKLANGGKHVITILQDHMGLEEDFVGASDSFKAPRGVTTYSFPGSASTKIATWKVTGNLGGEDYVDRIRGPFNEGGLYAERQGWHLPGFDDSRWSAGKPTQGISKAGVQFYRTSFNLDVPKGIDYPTAVAVSNSTMYSHFRAQIYLNGYQFGKYVNAIGPQTSFPIPEGVLNYRGKNTLAMSLWAHEAAGAKISNLRLEVRVKVESSKQAAVNLPFTPWSKRAGAY